MSGAAATNVPVSVAMSPGGNLAVGWVSVDGAGNPTAHLLYRPAGGPPEAIKLVTPVDGGKAMKHLELAVSDRGDAVAAWQETATVGYALHRPGQAWTGARQPPQYSFTSQTADPAVGVAADGTVTLAYGSTCSSGTTSALQVYVLRLDPADSWSSPQAVPNTVSPCGTMQIYDQVDLVEQPDGRAMLAARLASTDGTTAFAVMSAFRSTATGGWTATTESSSAHPTDPAVAFEPGGATATVWTEDGGVNYDYHPRLGANVKAGIGVAASTDPDVAIGADGEALVVYSPTSASGDPSAVRITPAGTAGSAQDLGAGIGNLSRPQVAANSTGTAIATYRKQNDAGIGALVRPPGGAFGSATTLGTGIADFPAIAADALGDITPTWVGIQVTMSGDVGAPGLAAYDGAPPAIASFSVPASLAPGVTGDYAASATDVWGPLTTGWTFGDGGVSGGATAQHAYSAPGSYTASFTASDAAGNTAARSGDVAVATPPTEQTPTAPTPISSPDCSRAAALVRVAKRPKVISKRKTIQVVSGWAVANRRAAGCPALSARAVLGVKRKGHRKRVVIATRTLVVAAGARAKLNFTLTKAGTALLRANKRLRVALIVTSGGAKVGVQTLTLIRPRG